MAPGHEGQTQTHPRKGESLSSSRGCQVRGVSGPEAVVPSQLVFRYEEWSCLSGCEGETDGLRNKVNRSQSLSEAASKVSFLIPPDPRYDAILRYSTNHPLRTPESVVHYFSKRWRDLRYYV